MPDKSFQAGIVNPKSVLLASLTLLPTNETLTDIGYSMLDARTSEQQNLADNRIRKTENKQQATDNPNLDAETSLENNRKSLAQTAGRTAPGQAEISSSVAEQLRRTDVNPKCNGLDPQYTYDLNGNRASMIGPSGETWTYEYDAADRLTKITNPGGEVTTFTYDAIRRRTSVTYPNDVVTSYTYDAASRLTGMTTDKGATNISSYSYTYDEVGNRLSMTDNDSTHNYVYSDVYRLTSATHPQAFNPNESFTYDPVGNRLSSHLSSTYDYDNLNRLLEDDTYTYSYDDNGNLTSKADKASSDTTTYQYDGENKLIQVDTPTDTVLYQYDGFGRRIAKTVNGVVTKYVYDREDILFESDENYNIKARYTHGPGVDEPISVDRDTDGNGTLDTTYYYHYDGLGSVTTITGTSGNVVQTYEYDTFGSIVDQTGSVENSHTYTGREWDAEAGLYYYRARYYDANTGRFIQGDPIGFSGGDVNFYVYVANNPVNLVDPWGLWKFTLSLYTPYYGLGGGITFGTNPDGRAFGTLRLGIGVGGGISYDPDGTSPGYDPCDNFEYYGGMTIGGYGEAGVGFRGIGASVDAEGGYVLTPGADTDHPYLGITPNIVGNSAWNYRFGAGAGFEIGIIN